MDEGKLFGRGAAFPPRISSDGRWAWSAGADNIRESIEVILLTDPGERLMLTSFGSGLGRFLFEPNTASTRRLIQERIQNALRLWEPRINVEQVSVAPDPDSGQRAIVTIEYRLIATQASSQITLAVDLGA
jgi:uncharacterized protein